MQPSARLRETKGVSVLIYDQVCAAEKRRRRKRGQMPDAGKRVFINELVCEGCGDCGRNPTASRSCRSKPSSAASAGSTRRAAIRTRPASTASARALLPSRAARPRKRAAERSRAARGGGAGDRFRRARQYRHWRHRRHRHRHHRRHRRHGRASRWPRRLGDGPDRTCAKGRRGHDPYPDRAEYRHAGSRAARARRGRYADRLRCRDGVESRSAFRCSQRTRSPSSTTMS